MVSTVYSSWSRVVQYLGTILLLKMCTIMIMIRSPCITNTVCKLVLYSTVELYLYWLAA